MGIFNKLKKGIEHAANQGYKEQKKLLKKPTKLVEASVAHIEKQLRIEIEKEYKKKYNHAASHIYDKIANSFLSSKDNIIFGAVGHTMKVHRDEILKEFKK